MKIKKLLPIASLASVAAIVTPLVTSCGNVIELTEAALWNEGIGLQNKKAINIKTKKQYDINIDISKIIIPSSNGGNGAWLFFVTADGLNDNLTTVKPIEIRIWVDDIELEQKDEPEEDDPYIFQVGPITESDDSWVIAGTCSVFKEKSKMKVTTSFEKKKDDCFIYFFELWHR